jgi:hypothetical protein
MAFVGLILIVQTSNKLGVGRSVGAINILILSTGSQGRGLQDGMSWEMFALHVLLMYQHILKRYIKLMVIFPKFLTLSCNLTPGTPCSWADGTTLRSISLSRKVEL